MSSFFSCFACGSSNMDQTANVSPAPITPQKVIPKHQTESKMELTQQFSDIKSHSATTMTYMTTDSFPTSSIEDQQLYIRKKVEQIRKKDLPERKAMESQFIKQNLAKSAVVYLVEKEWSELYTAFLKHINIKQLRSINNSRMFDNKNNIRTDIREKQDYFIINERVWKFVQQLYGGGPPIVQDMFFPVIALGNRRIQLPPRGIHNPMYMCYMISIMQCMFSNQHFAHHFIKKLYDDNKKKMLCHNIVHRMVKATIESDSPKIQIKELGALFQSRFNPQEQHDAHQFFIHFCNLLQEEAKNDLTVKSIQSKTPQVAYSHYFKTNKSIIDKLFIGQSQTTVQCVKCLVKSTTYDAFLDIQLDLMDTTIESSLKRHFDQEKIDDYECQKCNRKTKAFKKGSITKTPNYLVLTIKKFTNSGKKIEERVKYPYELNIKNYTKGHSGDSRYLLQSVLVHKGSKSTKGHYYCYTHRTKKSWHYISDQLTKELEHQQVFNRDAYMLFYERAK